MPLINNECNESESREVHVSLDINMDITVLPNNNHPEKFLQLDVGMLPSTHGMFQIGAALSGQRQWHNRVYSQVGELSLAPEQNIRLDCEEVDNGLIIFVLI